MLAYTSPESAPLFLEFFFSIWDFTVRGFERDQLVACWCS